MKRHIPVFCAVGSCLTLTGGLLVLFGLESSGKISDRRLTFAERVAYQRRTTKGASTLPAPNACEACRWKRLLQTPPTLFHELPKGILHAQPIAGHPPASPTRPLAEPTTAHSGPALK